MSAFDSGDMPSLPVELPISYGSNSIFLTAQAPRCLFTYLDIDIGQRHGGPFFVRCIAKEGGVESEIRVKVGTRSWHIPIFRANATYFIELGYYMDNQWSVISRSPSAQPPSDQPSSSFSFDYATIPLCLSFQQLLICIQSAILSGESPIGALARLQKKSQLFRLSNVSSSLLSEDEQTILWDVLGGDVLSFLSLPYPEIDTVELRSRIRRHLEQHLDAFSIRATPPGWGIKESGLFATLIALLNANTPPWDSWNRSTFTSWLRASQDGQKLEGSISSWGSTPQIPSWDSASSEEGRDFFLHVNAEVVFYGTTQPNSSVMIDSNPVRTNPDGSFLFRFVFPDGAYEIPIVATSPDGLETRSAVLRFHRVRSSSAGESDGKPATS